MSKVIQHLEEIKAELKHQAFNVALQIPGVVFSTGQPYLDGIRLEGIKIEGLLNLIKKNNLQLPSPVQYNYSLKTIDLSIKKNKSYEPIGVGAVEFQTRAEAMEFGRNLATLMGAEVRMDTGGSGTFIRPE